MTLQVVVRAIVDTADFFESAQTLLLHLYVEVDLVVERAFLLVELGESKRVTGDAECVQVEPLHLDEVVHIPRGQTAAHSVLRRDVIGGRFVLLVGPGDSKRLRRRGADRDDVGERRRVEENLELRLEELPHAIGALAWANLVPVRATDDCEPHRQLPPERLEFALEVQVHALRGLGPQVGAVLPHRTDSEREHHVEGAGGPQLPSAVRASDLQLADSRVDLFQRKAFVFLVRLRLE